MRVTEISELKVETTNWPCEGVGWGVASAAEAIVSSLTPQSCRRGERESNTITQEDHRTYPKPGKEKKSKYPNFYVPVQNEVAFVEGTHFISQYTYNHPGFSHRRRPLLHEELAPTFAAKFHPRNFRTMVRCESLLRYLKSFV